MSVSLEIPSRFVNELKSVSTDTWEETGPRTWKLRPYVLDWLKKNQIDEITGYNFVRHDSKYYIEFMNPNDAIRFKLVSTEWPKQLRGVTQWDAGLFYAPYIPMMTKTTILQNLGIISDDEDTP